MARRSLSTLPLGRLAGIPIGVQPAWVLIVALITWNLGHSYFPEQDAALSEAAAYVLGFVSALGLFAGILLHELGHAVVARRRGLVVDEIDLWLLGGVARMHGEPRTPRDELAYALAGPAVTAAILAVMGALSVALGTAGPDWIAALIAYQVLVSAAILIFNLIPAFPLDGGRVLRALLWGQFGDQRRATHAAAAIGRTFGYLLVGLGLFSFAGGAGVGGLWILLIGGFIVMAASGEEQGELTQHALANLTVADLMSSPASTLASDLTIAEAIHQGFTQHLYSSFPVVDAGGRALGLVSLRDIRATPPAARGSLRVAGVMINDPRLLVDPALPITELLLLPEFARHGRVVAVDDRDGRPVGLLSVTDIHRRLQISDLEVVPDHASAGSLAPAVQR